MSTRRKRRTFTPEFKKQIVDLYRSGKSRKEIIDDYDLSPSAFDKWVQQHSQSGSFKEKDNLTPEQQELRELRKENTQLKMENEILKQAALIFGRKLEVIKQNKHKYSISAMCQVLGISRSSYYYEAKKKASEADLEKAVIEEFTKSRNNYGTRKLKIELAKRGFIVSRRRIGRIMKKFNLVSNYVQRKYKVHSKGTNQSQIDNVLDRDFDSDEPMKIIVTDLTYVNIADKWFYICFIIDLFNREIIGYSSGPNKTVDLVHQALATIKEDLHNIEIFHTDRGKEFDNHTIDEFLETFNIDRSLSHKGDPYDNAVAESTYKSLKIEFIYQHTFLSLYELQYHLMDYVNWWNKYRIHGSLNYVSPVDYKQNWLKQQYQKVI
ncbi:MAG: IS3 family transposase [Clostridiales bacterium]|nr:IS3 family transposase [Clostridium sp.]NLY82480.1 IS3 family transposase [Clostridiales bacterium]